MNVRELLNKRATLWEDAKAVQARAEAEDRVMDAEERTQWDKINDEIDLLTVRIDDQKKAEDTHWDDIEAQNRALVPAGARLPVYQPAQMVDEAEHQRLQNAYLRNGPTLMDPDDWRAWHRLAYQSINQPAYQNAQVTTSGPAGGFTVRETWRTAVIEATKDYGGMREVAEVITTDDGGPMHFVVTDDTANVGYILPEAQQATETSVTFGLRTLQAYMYTSGYVPVSYQLLQDSAIDIEAYLTRTFATRIGRILNQHFTTGTGVNQPQGIMTAATDSGVTVAGTDVLDWTELVALEHSIDPSYRGMPGVRFVFNDSSLRKLKQMKDGEGRPIFLPGFVAGEPNTILGYRYVINQDMASMAASAAAVAFGDLSAYKIRDVRGMMVLRLEEIHALSAMVTFIAFSRHDGGLIDAGQGPVKFLTMHA